MFIERLGLVSVKEWICINQCTHLSYLFYYISLIYFIYYIYFTDVSV